jgi:hypothetical protein
MKLKKSLIKNSKRNFKNSEIHNALCKLLSIVVCKGVDWVMKRLNVRW